MTRSFLATTAMAVLLLSGCSGGPPQTPPQQEAAGTFRYPEDLWDAGVQGETVLRLFVTETGDVDSIRVERTSTYPAFDSAAVDGARDLHFRPALRGTDSVAAWVLLPVQFDLSRRDSTSGAAP